MTLEQIKADIASGKSTLIFYSSRTLWWTHLVDDIKETTEKGKKLQQEQFERMMKDPSKPRPERERLAAIYEQVKDSRVPLGLDGAPMMQADAAKWIAAAEAKPDHFGRHGLDAMLKAHHANCGGLVGDRWEFYNELLD